MDHIPPPMDGYDRAWMHCTKHDRYAYRDYIPFSLSNPILEMPCSCDGKAPHTTTVDEKVALAAIKKQAQLAEDEKYYRKDWMTDGQWRCALVAAELKHGFHHVSDLRQCGDGIMFREPNEMATYDFDLMTRAVLAAHRSHVRIGCSIDKTEDTTDYGEYYTYHYLRITIHPRDPEGERLFSRHPGLEELHHRIGVELHKE